MYLKLTSALAAMTLLTGCLDVADCDPNRVNNVLTSAGCSNQGKFAERQQNLGQNAVTIRAEVERERIAISRANTKIRSLQASQRLSASQVATLNREINALNGDVNRLSRSSNAQESAALRQKIQARKNAINSFANVAVI